MDELNMDDIKYAAMDYVVGDKKYKVSYDPDDLYFNTENAQIVRARDTGSIFRILTQYFPKKAEGMVDVGANMGLMTLLMSQFVKNDKNILSIEPDPNNYKYLERNCVSNKLKPILRNYAVGEKPGSMTFQSIFGKKYGSHIMTTETLPYVSIVPTSDPPPDNPLYDVKVETLDTLVAESRLKNVDFIKIDTEGHEWQVLKGGKNTMERFNPWVYLEFCPWTLLAYSNTNPRTFLEFITDSFQQVGQARKDDIFWIKNRQDFTAFLKDNLVNNGSVDNLLLRFHN